MLMFLKPLPCHPHAFFPACSCGRFDFYLCADISKGFLPLIGFLWPRRKRLAASALPGFLLRGYLCVMLSPRPPGETSVGLDAPLSLCS